MKIIGTAEQAEEMQHELKQTLIVFNTAVRDMRHSLDRMKESCHDAECMEIESLLMGIMQLMVDYMDDFGDLNTVLEEYRRILEQPGMTDLYSSIRAGYPQNQILSGKISAFSSHENILGSNFVQGMQNVLNKSIHTDVKRLYEKYGDKLSIQNAETSGKAFYRHGEGVYINKNKVSSGDDIHKPYQTAFHEFGHNIDYLLGNGQPISESWGNGALLSAIQQDFTNLKGSMDNADLILYLRKKKIDNKWTLKDIASVSDILESLTGVSYPLGAGHGCTYWDNRLPCKEFFAETLDAAAANEESYKIMKDMFPNAVAIVHKIIGGVV